MRADLPYRTSWLLSITKLRNLKAIHNSLIEYAIALIVVINHKTTKFESNSQRVLLLIRWEVGCYQSQNYEIWKQFTTDSGCSPFYEELLSITKLRNLKAIHNCASIWGECSFVVINHKTTKFESNSQHKCLIYQIVPQRYKKIFYK